MTLPINGHDGCPICGSDWVLHDFVIRKSVCKSGHQVSNIVGQQHIAHKTEYVETLNITYPKGLGRCPLCKGNWMFGFGEKKDKIHYKYDTVHLGCKDCKVQLSMQENQIGAFQFWRLSDEGIECSDWTLHRMIVGRIWQWSSDYAGAKGELGELDIPFDISEARLAEVLVLI